MSGPNPPDQVPGGHPRDEAPDELTDTGFSRAYSAPESEQYAIAPFIPADLELYDYDSYDQGAEPPADLSPPKWPWVVGVTAIIAAISLVVSVSLLVTRSDPSEVAAPSSATSQPRCRMRSPPPRRRPASPTATAATSSATDRDGHGDTRPPPPPRRDRGAAAEPRAAAPTTAPASAAGSGRSPQVTYSVTGAKAPR